MASARVVLLATVLAVAIPGSARAADGIPRGMLPDDVVPERYRLQLDLDPRQPTFHGIAEIDIALARPTRTIWLHGLGLAVRAVSIDTGGTRSIGRYVETEPINGVARLDFPAEVPAGHATLRFDYTAGFRQGAEGLFRMEEGGEWYVFSQLEAIDARRVFPGFDEPRFKTSFDISVTAPAGDRVISNTPERQSQPVDDGKGIRHDFERTLPLPTYLLAFAVGPLDIVEGTLPANSVRKGSLPLRAVATKGKAPRLQYAIEHTPAIVAELEQYFGIPYPYSKLDVIASPQQGGAMENAGAIIFNDSLLVLDAGASPAQQGAFFVVMAHEVAHQWFGDLVTPRWWTDIWLNESFAEWMGIKIAQRLRPDLGFDADRITGVTRAMELDSRRAGRPIQQTIDDNSQVISAFDGITYQKGAGVLSMVETYLGEEVFRQGVQLHMQRHALGVADSGQFFASMADAAQQPAVLEAFRSFVNQPGVPLVSLSPAATPGTWRLQQHRYIPLGSTLQDDTLWQVPFCARTHDGKAKGEVHCALLAQRTGTLSVPGSHAVLMPNAGGTGYYRFALDAAELDRLIDFAPRLPESEAIMLADSISAGFLAGRVPFEKLLAAARQLAAHPSRSAATMLGSSLNDVRNRWADPGTRAKIERELRTLYKPRVTRLGLDLRRDAYASEPGDRRLERVDFVALTALDGRDPELRAQMVAAARASLEDPVALDPEFRFYAWAVAVQELGDPFAQQLEQALLASQDSELRSDAAWAMGYATQPAASARALNLVNNPKLRTGEQMGLLYGQFRQPETRAAAWTWLTANVDPLLQRLPNLSRRGAFRLPSTFCDAEHRRDIDRVLTPKAKAVGSGSLDVERALESIDLCVAQKAALGPAVARGLN